MKKIFAVIIFLFAVGCVTNKYNIDYNDKIKFNGNGLVVILKKKSDPINLQDQLEHRLNKLGFSVKAQMYTDESIKDSQEVLKVKGIKADYALIFHYHTYKSFLLEIQSFDAFSATMKDLKTGMNVLSFSFKGGKDVSDVLDELDSKLKNLLD